MGLDAIAQIAIDANTRTPSRTGFGKPLVMAYHTEFLERTREYTSVADMITDGFATTSPAVRAATALFAQNPAPPTIVLGREALTSVLTELFTPVVLDSTVYTLYFNGQAATYTSDATATAAEISAAMKIAIDALGLNVTVTDNTGSFTVAADTVADNYYWYMADPALWVCIDQTTDGGIVADITACRLENDDWYSLHLTVLSPAVIAAAAVHIETLVKIMVTSSSDSAIATVGAGDIATTLQTANYARTALIYHPKAIVQYPGAAWAGKCLPKDPGSITWKFKTLAGVDVTTLTSAQVGYIEGKDCNYYQEVAGIGITQQGITAAAEFIDITRSLDWVRARLQETLFGDLANADKIPFTDPGVGVVEAGVRSVLQEATKQGVFSADPAFTVTVPLVADVSTTNKASRHLPDVVFNATLAGAIHTIAVEGHVTV